ncbi:hypothetical protein C1J05_19675 [Sulfitobacter sp. JL08]|uniref:hypothetical protein n=1 Tax=Sulfitobacter sp. JL08 TaxID=2070369 RepID=UPI000E0BE689|nr:hypothetical protein [Sulfitobacter sp. JL08]AXI56429.1 hypothetical protein C1J05_19675 [Sulfitobacter sp. JL08]
MAHNKSDDLPVATPATSATWGIPDWRDAAAYGDVKAWSLGRWRWEFFRRRDDVRILFDERKDKQYENRLAKWERDCARPELTPKEQAYILRKVPDKPDDPRFHVSFLTEEQKKFGYIVLFNPRIGNVANFDKHVERLDSYEWDVSGEHGDRVLQETKLEEHQLVIAFSTDRPLARQLEDAESCLKGLQKYRHGRIIKKLRHPAKWLEYLRTLDAHADNPTESWADLAKKLFEHKLIVRRKDPCGGYCDPPPQAARDKWKTADALRFNF